MDIMDVINEWADEFSDDADTQEEFVEGMIQALFVICISDLRV